MTITADDHRSTFGSGPVIGLAEFYGPYDVSVTKTSIYVIDTGNYRVKRYTKNATNPTTMPGAASLFKSYYLFVDSSSNLYLSDFQSNQVICFTSGYSFRQVVVGNGTIGSRINQLNGPLGIFIDDSGAVYVADYNNHRVQKWN